MSPDSSSRSKQLNGFFLAVLSGNRQLQTQQNGELFIEALCSQPDPETCVEKVILKDAGLAAISKCVRFSVSTAFQNNHACNLLLYLSYPGVKNIVGGEFLQKIVISLVEPPTFWSPFVQSFKAGSLNQKAQEAFAWLLLQLVSLPPDSVDDDTLIKGFKATAAEEAVQKRLNDSDHQEVRNYGYKIGNILATLSKPVDPSVKADDLGPGGRHDNDFMEIERIAILPTADELTSREIPYFRTANAVEASSDDVRFRVAAHLDNQFRLLREDMIGEIRDELQIAMGIKKGRKHRGTIMKNLTLEGTDCGAEKRREFFGLLLKHPRPFPGLERYKEEKQRRRYLQDHKGFFKHQSVACILVDGNVVAFPSIHRDEDLLSKPNAVVILRFEDCNVLNKVLLKIKGSEDVQLIQINTSVFAYEPILNRLKIISEITLAEEVLMWKDGATVNDTQLSKRLKGLASLITSSPSTDLKKFLDTQKSIKLDDSQAKCFVSGIKQRVSLIQGPPGTGKSFVGALITKAIYQMSAKTILVVCYTNHALDQFLEDLLDTGIPANGILRLGGKSTPRTKPLSLFEQKDEVRMSRDTWQKIDKIKAKMADLEIRLRDAFNRYKHGRIFNRQVMEHIEFLDGPPFFFDAFQVPSQEDGMKVVGNKGRAVSQSYLLERWTLGHDAGIFKKQDVFKTHRDVWQIPREERKRIRTEWETAILAGEVQDFTNMVKLYNECHLAQEALRKEKDVTIVKKKRIIGCTTTAAAKYARELQAADPQAIVVEEAGEILESHILTSLCEHTDQLVLIGDHKQLRPKIANYKLSVEKGQGYNLNVSLFERLVLKGFPHYVLSQQHRMRPEISSLVRALTYPNLIDAPSTTNRDNIRGLQKNVVFVSHSKPEVDADQLSDRKDVQVKASKQNKYEVEMVLKFVKYLGQQGYGTDDIVVLTPYLGQLSLLQKMLSKENDPVLNDLDSFDLVQAGIIPEESAKLTKKPIYISTIDNYQGEERKIVVTTLTRSNAECEIGFMAAHERLNVLLSRARDGLIMIGNPHTFQNCKKGQDTWVPFFELMQKDGNVFGGLPVKCERHPDRKIVLKTPMEFEEETPDGGCLEPCGAMLSCQQHKCPSKCHQISDHSKMKCLEIIPHQCSVGHDLSYKCHQSKPQSCKKCDKEAEKQKKLMQEGLDRQLKREQEQKEHDRQMLILNDEINAQNEILRDRALAEQRANALAMKQKDLENAKKQADAASKRRSARANSSSAPIAQPRNLHIPVATAPLTSGGVPLPTQSPSWTPSGSVGPARSQTAAAPSPTLPTNPSSSQPPPPPSASTPAPTVTSKAVAEWERQKSLESASNPAIDGIMEMIGLEQVKQKILGIKAQVETAVRQNRDLKDERFHVSLLGNPGTGKTTVARLYGKVLTSLGVLSGTAFVETTGSRMSNEGVPGAQKMVDNIVNNGGGVILIDEAYQLVESGSAGGKQVLDFLLAEMENNRDKLVFILTGYNKEMEKFFEHNPGLQSRVPHSLQFEDYTDAELQRMFKQMARKKFKGQLKIEGGEDGLYVRIAIRRLGRGRNMPGFGNARALQNLFSKIVTRQAERIAEARANGELEDDFAMTKEDLIGPDPSKAAFESKAWKELQSLIGLKDVKEAVKSMISRLKTNYDRELLEKEIIQLTPNKVFVGNPGTGKTSVAKVYGQILKDIGMLSNGEVIIKNPSDFIGSVLGQSESNTKAILSNTVGKVLIIDEAYMLYQKSGSGVGGQHDPYRTAVIDTIVAEVQNVPGDDRCVLLLGYRQEMEEMYQNINPGFKRRFPLDEAFDFKDYNDDDLRKIMNLYLEKGSLEATEEAKDVAINILARSRNRPNFGNAGEVKNLLSKASSNMNIRISRSGSADDKLLPEDFDKDYARGVNATLNTEKIFADVVGCEEIVKKLKGYQKVAETMKQRGMDASKYIPTTFVFKGPPGTGKTTTARKMGQVFYDMGFLSSAEVVECSASDIIAPYVGQTGRLTRETVTKALGKVLFVDEAYRLAEPGSFAKEAIDELVDILTKPQFAGKVIVILAGYDNDMDRLLSVNAGLASRFSEEIIFNNMSASHCLKVLFAEVSRNNISVDRALTEAKYEPYKTMIGLIGDMSKISGWANARDVITLAKEVIRTVLLNTTDGELTLKPDVMITAANAFLDKLKKRQPPPIQTLHGFGPFPGSNHGPRAEPPPAPVLATPTIATQTKVEERKQNTEVAEVAQADDCCQERDAGVSDDVWNQLQLDKKNNATAEAAAEVQVQSKKEEVSKLKKESAKLKDKEKDITNRDPEDEERKRKLEQLRLERLRLREEYERARRAAEEAERKRREEREKEAKAQAKLRDMGVCCAGFRWIKQSSGYRCAGGSHYVSNLQLGI